MDRICSPMTTILHRGLSLDMRPCACDAGYFDACLYPHSRAVHHLLRLGGSHAISQARLQSNNSIVRTLSTALLYQPYKSAVATVTPVHARMHARADGHVYVGDPHRHAEGKWVRSRVGCRCPSNATSTVTACILRLHVPVVLPLHNAGLHDSVATGLRHKPSSALSSVSLRLVVGEDKGQGQQPRHTVVTAPHEQHGKGKGRGETR